MALNWENDRNRRRGREGERLAKKEEWSEAKHERMVAEFLASKPKPEKKRSKKRKPAKHLSSSQRKKKSFRRRRPSPYSTNLVKEYGLDA